MYLFGTPCGFATENLAADYAIISVKQTISDIATSARVRNLYPGTKLYGAQGRLAILLELNSNIKNKDAVYPGDKILIVSNRDVDRETESRQVASFDVKDKEVLDIHQKKEAAVESGFSRIHLITGGSFFRIDAVDSLSDSTGEILSTLSPDFKMNWEPRIDEKTYLSIGIETSSTQWQNPVGRTIRNRKENVSAGFFSFGRHLQSGNRATVTLKQAEKLILRSITTEELKLEKAFTTNVDAEFLYNLIVKGPFRFDSTVAFGLSSSAESGDLRIRQGNYFNLGLELSQSLKKYQITSGIKYLTTNYKTNFSDNTNSQIQFLFGIVFKIDD